MVGSPTIMREQMDELVVCSTAPNVTLRVLPFEAKPVFTMTCMYAHFEYEDSDYSDVVNIETHAGFFLVENAEQAEKYRIYYDRLMCASLTEDASRELIRKIRDATID
jgi:hypothetical protein